MTLCLLRKVWGAEAPKFKELERVKTAHVVSTDMISRNETTKIALPERSVGTVVGAYDF